MTPPTDKRAEEAAEQLFKELDYWTGERHKPDPRIAIKAALLSFAKSEAKPLLEALEPFKCCGHEQSKIDGLLSCCKARQAIEAHNTKFGRGA